jgi:hypothetical protein
MPATLIQDVAAKPMRCEAYEEDDFVVFPVVPVFKEHVREVDDPESTPEKPLPRIRVKFDADDMESIALACNERIEDTGDFPVICVRHNPEDGSEDRDVVGFFGPFWTDDFGNKTPRKAVFAQFRIFKKERERTDRYPRHSVEYWPASKDPRDPDYRRGTFDPCSLLGSEAPHLDLGLRYQKSQSGRRSLNYQMDAPATTAGGSNTFVPGMVKDDEKKLNYGEGEGSEEKEPEKEMPGEENEPANDNPTNEDTEATGSESDNTEFSPEMTALLDAVGDMFEEYQARLEAMEKHLGLNGMTGMPLETAPAAGAEGDMPPVAPAAPVAPPEQTGLPTNPEGQVAAPPAVDAPAAPPTDSPAPADKDKDKPVAYKREIDQLKAEVVQLRAERDAAKAADVTAQRKALRYSKLENVANQGFVIDIESELELTDELSDAKFDKYVELGPQRYQKGKTILPMSKPDRPTLQYSKLDMKRRGELSAKAREAVKVNPKIAYVDSLKNICSENGIELDPENL